MADIRKASFFFIMSVAVPVIGIMVIQSVPVIGIMVIQSVPVIMSMVMVMGMFLTAAFMFMNAVRIPVERDLNVGPADGITAYLIDLYIIAFDAELSDLIYDSRRFEAQINKRPDAHISADSCKAVKV